MTDKNKPIGHGDTVEVDGFHFTVRYLNDDSSRTSWSDGDGYGSISDPTSREKTPGERVIYSDRWGKRYYDWQGTIAKAKSEGWGLGEEELAKLTAKLGRTPTKGEITEQSVANDFEYHRAWLNDEWRFVTIHVRCEETGEDDYLGGVETYKDFNEKYPWESMIPEALRNAKEQRAAELAETAELQSIADRVWRMIFMCHKEQNAAPELIASDKEQLNKLLAKTGVQVK